MGGLAGIQHNQRDVRPREQDPDLLRVHIFVQFSLFVLEGEIAQPLVDAIDSVPIEVNDVNPREPLAVQSLGQCCQGRRVEELNDSVLGSEVLHGVQHGA